jgi:hypothetical protein
MLSCLGISSCFLNSDRALVDVSATFRQAYTPIGSPAEPLEAVLFRSFHAKSLRLSTQELP